MILYLIQSKSVDNSLKEKFDECLEQFKKNDRNDFLLRYFFEIFLFDCDLTFKLTIETAWL